MVEKIKRLSIPSSARIIVISDIHGELALLKKLLIKVDFKKEDYLIINGDLCEKGSNSNGVLHYVMHLSSENEHVHIIEGNCDTLIENLIEEDPGLIRYLCTREHSILNEWLDCLDIQMNEDINLQAIKELLTSNFSNEIQWLTELPTAIETEDYIFVHAGLSDLENWKETDRNSALTIPSFLNKQHHANKYVIVGHWPVINYSFHTPSHNPIIDHKKKIIAIDGGNIIKNTGQLNALMIEKQLAGVQFTYTYVDNFPTRKVTKTYKADLNMTGFIGYPTYNIIPIEKGDYFTLCKQTETENYYYVKNEYIQELTNGKFSVKGDISCTQLNVDKGEKVSIIDDSCNGYTLIKKEGFIGWVTKDCLAD